MDHESPSPHPGQREAPRYHPRLERAAARYLRGSESAGRSGPGGDEFPICSIPEQPDQKCRVLSPEFFQDKTLLAEQGAEHKVFLTGTSDRLPPSTLLDAANNLRSEWHNTCFSLHTMSDSTPNEVTEKSPTLKGLALNFNMGFSLMEGLKTEKPPMLGRLFKNKKFDAECDWIARAAYTVALLNKANKLNEHALNHNQQYHIAPLSLTRDISRPEEELNRIFDRTSESLPLWEKTRRSVEQHITQQISKQVPAAKQGIRQSIKEELSSISREDYLEALGQLRSATRLNMQGEAERQAVLATSKLAAVK